MSEDRTITIPLSDYLRLLQASEADDTIVRCETCGAWLAIEDPATAVVDDYTGCWKMAAGENLRPDNCRSYRAPPTPAERSRGMTDIVERLRGEEWDGEIPLNVVDMLEDAADEIDRLRAALLAFAAHFGPLEDNHMLHPEARKCFALARAALGEKA